MLITPLGLKRFRAVVRSTDGALTIPTGASQRMDERRRMQREYEALLNEEIFAKIAAAGVLRYCGSQLFRRESGREAEFKPLVWFESLDAVGEFAEEDYTNRGSLSCAVHCRSSPSSSP